MVGKPGHNHRVEDTASLQIGREGRIELAGPAVEGAEVLVPVPGPGRSAAGPWSLRGRSIRAVSRVLSGTGFLVLGTWGRRT